MQQNKILKRQLKKLNISTFKDLDENKFQDMLHVISSTYDEGDQNIYRIERALEVSTNELSDFNNQLEHRVQKEVKSNLEHKKQLLEQSRFASLGEMIGNIAHQWRQPLSAISSLSSGMKIQVELGLTSTEEIIDSYDKINNFTLFLNQTIEDFRNYMKEDTQVVEFDILKTIKDTISIIISSYNANNLILDFNVESSKPLMSKGQPSEISQVFLNILNNAKDAIIEKNIDNGYVKISHKVINGFNIIYIHDNAGGIPLDIINKIFDPYFTTKHQSQGTGIGLYMSKDIIKKHKGFLSVKNKEFKIKNKTYLGACFKISLPIK